MNIDTRRLQYLLKNYTQKAISQLSSIPTSTLSYVVRGLRNLPGKYNSILRNLYQRTVMYNLKSLGASYYIRKRFSWYIPERVQQVEQIFFNLVENKASEYINRKFLQSGQSLSDEEMTDLYGKTKEGIIESLLKSGKSYDDIAKS